MTLNDMMTELNQLQTSVEHLGTNAASRAKFLREALFAYHEKERNYEQAISERERELFIDMLQKLLKLTSQLSERVKARLVLLENVTPPNGSPSPAA